jgi:hypothetical protein
MKNVTTTPSEPQEQQKGKKLVFLHSFGRFGRFVVHLNPWFIGEGEPKW